LIIDAFNKLGKSITKKAGRKKVFVTTVGKQTRKVLKNRIPFVERKI